MTAAASARRLWSSPTASTTQVGARSSASILARSRARPSGPSSCAACARAGSQGSANAICDQHEGLKSAIERILDCPWQRCTVHFVRNMHGHCRPSERGLVSAALREIFNAPDRAAAQAHLGEVLERFRGPLPKIAALLEQAEEDLLAFYRFPASHRTKLRSTNPLERFNKEIGRRSDVVGIFPNAAAAIRLIGAMVIEQNDEWLVCRRYLSEESLALVLED